MCANMLRHLHEKFNYFMLLDIHRWYLESLLEREAATSADQNLN